MESSASVSEWLEQLQDGDADAAETKLFNRYFEQLASQFKPKLRNGPRSVEDEDDVAQVAIYRVFAKLGDGEYPDIRDRDSLWRVLLTAAKNRFIDLYRRNQRRPSGGQELCNDDVVDGHPSPERVLEFEEWAVQMMAKLSSPKLQETAQLKLEGHSNREIADQMEVAVRTVERYLKRIDEIWSPEPE